MIEDKNISEKLNRFLDSIKMLKEFERIEFIIFYGSLAQGRSKKKSDVDICIYYNTKKYEDMSKFRLKLLRSLRSDIYDVQMSQQLPIWVRKEVIKGKILCVRDKRF